MSDSSQSSSRMEMLEGGGFLCCLEGVLVFEAMLVWRVLRM